MAHHRSINASPAPQWTVLPEDNSSMGRSDDDESSQSMRDELDSLSPERVQKGPPRKRKGSDGSPSKLKVSMKKYRVSTSEVEGGPSTFAQRPEGGPSFRSRPHASAATSGGSVPRPSSGFAPEMRDEQDGAPPPKQYARKQSGNRGRTASSVRVDRRQNARPTQFREPSRQEGPPTSSKANGKRRKSSTPSSSSEESDSVPSASGKPPNAWANAWKGKEVHRKPTFQSSNKPPRPEGSGSSRGEGLKSVAQSEPEVIVIIDSEDEAQVVPKPIVIDDSEADTVVQHKVEPKVANEYICISSDSEEDNHSPIEQPEHLPSAPPPVARANDDGMKASPDAIQPILSSDSTMDIEQQPNEQHQEQPSGGSPTLENIVPQLGDLALVTTPDESRALKLASPSPATPSSVPKSPASTTSTKNTRPHAPALYDGENGFFKSAYKSRQIPHAPPAIDKPSTAGATSSSSSTFVVAQVSCILEPNSKNNEDPPQAGMIGVANLSVPTPLALEPREATAPSQPLVKPEAPPPIGTGVTLSDVLDNMYPPTTYIDLTLSDGEDTAEPRRPSTSAAVSSVTDDSPKPPSRPNFLPLPRGNTSSKPIPSHRSSPPPPQESPHQKQVSPPPARIVEIADVVKINSADLGGDAVEVDEVTSMLQSNEASDDEEPQPLPPRRSRRRKRHVSVDDDIAPSRPNRSASSSTSSLNSMLELPRSRRAKATPKGPTISDVLRDPDFLASIERMNKDATPTTVWTWMRDRDIIGKEFADVYARASDLPHLMEDEMNALPEFARHANEMQRKIFEAAIAQADMTHRSPPIRIINTIDNEMTPPFEFHYTNLMYHSDQVPKPDLDNLVGCDCRGKCNPKNRKCACVRRQEEVMSECGFAYDANRTLQYHQLPIHECNAMCRCDDDCQNRVVQHGRQVAVNIQKTANKGWGIFAAQYIPAHTFLGIYSGEYVTDREGEHRGSLYNNFGRSYLFDLDFWYLKHDGEDDVKFTIDAFHAGNFTRYLNHSCDPNCKINAVYINEANRDKPLITIFTCQNVRSGEELCFSYHGSEDEEEEEEQVRKSKKKKQKGKAKEKTLAPVYAACMCGARNCRGSMWS